MKVIFPVALLALLVVGCASGPAVVKDCRDTTSWALCNDTGPDNSGEATGAGPATE